MEPEKTPPGSPVESAKAAGKRPVEAGKVGAAGPAAKQQKKAAPVAEPAAAPPFEVINKTPEEYAATLAKLSVAKVCNKKHRPSGSDEQFVLCESIAGLQSHQNCSGCQRRGGTLMLGGKPESRHGGKRCPAWFLLPDHPSTASGNYPTGKYNGFKWKGRCCNRTCADAVAKALYQHEHEGVPYPEGFQPPPPTSAPPAAAQ